MKPFIIGIMYIKKSKRVKTYSKINFLIKDEI